LAYLFVLKVLAQFFDFLFFHYKIYSFKNKKAMYCKCVGYKKYDDKNYRRDGVGSKAKDCASFEE